ncbi:MAG TPA: hypothetical protein P5560_07000 [Thermotogota bacterium]|nr:hypothetical protein [Thermotogota bacterium]HRW92673.1 hypothetical protein [Thermotogota bacterium]
MFGKKANRKELAEKALIGMREGKELDKASWKNNLYSQSDFRIF